MSQRTLFAFSLGGSVSMVRGRELEAEGTACVQAMSPKWCVCVCVCVCVCRRE